MATAPASRVKSTASTLTTSEIGYPHGHLGYLSDHAQDALERFKDVVEERGYWTRGPPASHDDALLLRFLRARRWVVEDAFKQFKDTEDWRKANELDILYRTIDLESYEQSRRVYPQWTGRRDRRGIPLYVFEIHTLDWKTVQAYEKAGAGKQFSQAKSDGKTPPGMLRLFALYENLTNFNMPFSTQLTDREYPDVPITMTTNIVDVSGVGLKQFWNLKSHMQAASQLATAHYPETLDRIFIIGAPFFFSTVWGWIKRWFDPITVSKIFVLSAAEVKPTLESFIDIRNIPKKYGGELDFSFGQLSVPDPSWEGVVEWENGYKSFPTGPMIWEPEQDGERLACIGMGYENGKERRVRICTIPKTFEMPVSKPTAEATVEEGTQTEEPAEQDTTTHTSETLTDNKAADAVTNGSAIEKLTVADEKHPEPEKDAAPTVPTAAA